MRLPPQLLSAGNSTRATAAVKLYQQCRWISSARRQCVGVLHEGTSSPQMLLPLLGLRGIAYAAARWTRDVPAPAKFGGTTGPRTGSCGYCLVSGDPLQWGHARPHP